LVDVLGGGYCCVFVLLAVVMFFVVMFFVEIFFVVMMDGGAVFVRRFWLWRINRVFMWSSQCIFVSVLKIRLSSIRS